MAESGIKQAEQALGEAAIVSKVNETSVERTVWWLRECGYVTSVYQLSQWLKFHGYKRVVEYRQAVES